MCGRFYVEDDDALAERILRLNRGARLRTGDINPGQTAAVLTGGDRLRADTMKWGFPSFDNKLIINARSESAAQKPMFRELWRSFRLLIPAHGYYEWDASGTKHFLGTGGGLYLAGLFRPDERSFTILTTEAAAGLKAIHPRMPLIFSKTAAKAWLDPQSDPARVMNDAETDAVQPLIKQMRLEV